MFWPALADPEARASRSIKEGEQKHMAQQCSHLDQIRDVTPSANGCEDCLKTGQPHIKALPLIPRSVAAFYRELMDCLHTLGIQVMINTLPSEVRSPIRCDIDEVHASYDPLYAQRFWRILTQTATVMQRFRSPFVGKSSPVHFFWGSFDLAVTLFSGRRVPERPGVPRFAREDTTYEQISCGCWPGNDSFPAPAFFAYTSP